MIIKSSFRMSSLVDVADDGEKGWQKFEARTDKFLNQNECDCGLVNCPNKFYRLIFMDLNMPVMDGFESAAKILEYQNAK